MSENQHTAQNSPSGFGREIPGLDFAPPTPETLSYAEPAVLQSKRPESGHTGIKVATLVALGLIAAVGHQAAQELADQKGETFIAQIEYADQHAQELQAFAEDPTILPQARQAFAESAADARTAAFITKVQGYAYKADSLVAGGAALGAGLIAVAGSAKLVQNRLEEK